MSYPPTYALSVTLWTLVLVVVTLTGKVTTTVGTSDEDECVIDLAVVCLDDKLLVYVNWLEKRDKLNVVGDLVTIVKKNGSFEDRTKTPYQQRVSNSLGPAIDEYFDTHTLRISLPWILDGDIDLELDQQGRGKKSKLKQLKKMMSMLGVIMCAKLSLMGPLAMVMIGAKALKALMLSVMALTISKMVMLKKMKGGGGGGGGGLGGSLVQAEWSADKDDRNAHLLAYSGQSKVPVGPSQSPMTSAYQQQSQPLYPSYEQSPHVYHGAV
ncbi:uncharacterized protein LOC126839172 [Adelges cooleyi]|uniref:uncharacterized protein LOC126839172 n=1 Tax=Adelges cooleyi TaxID=133065 RepID=UPI00218010D4|nr:uncharacterized protein LOC126839172 [Adelges cooleyi]